MEKVRILLKMIWYNRKNYILYLVCNIFVIAFFQAFLSIGENESFMSADKIDPMISSNIFAPTVLTALFMILLCHMFMRLFEEQKAGVCSINNSWSDAI